VFRETLTKKPDVVRQSEFGRDRTESQAYSLSFGTRTLTKQPDFVRLNDFGQDRNESYHWKLFGRLTEKPDHVRLSSSGDRIRIHWWIRKLSRTRRFARIPDHIQLMKKLTSYPHLFSFRYDEAPSFHVSFQSQYWKRFHTKIWAHSLSFPFPGSLTGSQRASKERAALNLVFNAEI